MKILIFSLAAVIMLNINTFAEIPESARSKRVISKITPVLEKEMKSKNLKPGDNVFIRIFKEEFILEVWVKNGDAYTLFKQYPIAYYSGGLGTKTKFGDCKSPEGFYSVYPASLNPSSSYHLSFNIGYPNAYERHRKYTGNYIMIHGGEVSIGCYAVTDPLIEEIYTAVYRAFENGQKKIMVHIFPFRMTDENFQRYKNNPNLSFWTELRGGYEYFENKRVPPEILVDSKGNYYIAQ